MSSQPLTQDQLVNFQDQIVRMQQFMASMQPTQPSGPSSSIAGSSSLGSVPGPFREAITAIAVPPPTVLSSGGQTVQTQSFSVPSSGLITPYQSVRSLQGLGTVPQSHPLTMGSVTAASATQPFLGFNSLGVSPAFMEEVRGTRRGSYIWGRYVYYLVMLIDHRNNIIL